MVLCCGDHARNGTRICLRNAMTSFSSRKNVTNVIDSYYVRSVVHVTCAKTGEILISDKSHLRVTRLHRIAHANVYVICVVTCKNFHMIPFSRPASTRMNLPSRRDCQWDSAEEQYTRSLSRSLDRQNVITYVFLVMQVSRRKWRPILLFWNVLCRLSSIPKRISALIAITCTNGFTVVYVAD